jgi:hypothetical protein
VPGVGPLHVPALPGLDRGLVALMGDFPGHAAAVEFVAGLLRVVAGVEVDGDVIRERAEVVEFVQRGGQQRGVVPAPTGDMSGLKSRRSGISAVPPRLLPTLLPSRWTAPDARARGRWCIRRGRGLNGYTTGRARDKRESLALVRLRRIKGFDMRF